MQKSRKNFANRLKELTSRYAKVNEEYFDELEQILIEADVGVNLTLEIIDATKKNHVFKEWKTQNKLTNYSLIKCSFLTPIKAKIS